MFLGAENCIKIIVKKRGIRVVHASGLVIFSPKYLLDLFGLQKLAQKCPRLPGDFFATPPPKKRLSLLGELSRSIGPELELVEFRPFLSAPLLSFLHMLMFANL